MLFGSASRTVVQALQVYGGDSLAHNTEWSQPIESLFDNCISVSIRSLERYVNNYVFTPELPLQFVLYRLARYYNPSK
jgi:hypothetical protein